jgi:ATP-binding cassette subfamily F protein uup
LQELLGDYPGTVLVVSHDRDFLDRVATSVIASEGDGRWVDYAGGYSDMLAQRGPVSAAATVVKTRPAVRAEQAPQRARRLSFKDKHALETLPGKIAALQGTIAKLQTLLADHDLYAKNPARFQKATQDLTAAEQALAAAEEQWLVLEMMREELEA